MPLRKPSSLLAITGHLLATDSLLPSLWPVSSNGSELTEIRFILHTALPEEL